MRSSIEGRVFSGNIPEMAVKTLLQLNTLKKEDDFVAVKTLHGIYDSLDLITSVNSARASSCSNTFYSFQINDRHVPICHHLSDSEKVIKIFSETADRQAASEFLDEINIMKKIGFHERLGEHSLISINVFIVHFN